MKFTKILFCCTVALAAIACDESEGIGSSIIEDEIEIVMDSTFSVYGQSIANDSVQSRTITQLLGKIDADGYGSLSSDIVTQLMPANKIDTVGVTVNDIDSIKMVLYMPLGGYTGDSITPMGLNIYRLNKQLPSPIFSNFSPADYYSKSDLIASKIYTTCILGVSDSIANLSYRYIEIPLPLSLARELFNKYKENPEVYSVPSAFAEWFPGLYIANSFGNGRVVNITSSEIKFYYRKTVKIEDTETDTTYYKTGNYFTVSPEVVTNNNITLCMSENLKKMASGGENVIVSPAGMDVQLTFPTREIIERYRNASGNLSVVNSLYFEIPAEEIDNEYGINPPPYLLFVKSSEKESFFANSSITDDINSFYATYNESSKKYVFSDMRQYIMTMLKKETIEDKDVTFTLTPVNISTETTGSSYYYSGSTYINGVTPYITAPSMVKLNLQNAKIKFTYSKQTIN